jgi:hypothetical protein
MDGVWERVWRAVLTSLDEAGKLDWSRALLDGSFVPAKKGGSKLMLVVESQAYPSVDW